MNRLNHMHALTGIIFLLLATPVFAQTIHSHAAAPASPPPQFIASDQKPFSKLMDESMQVMDYGMAHALVNGDPAHDFVTMMIPHHQGAIDMAKSLLVYSKDPELRNLAQQIITDQQLEINVMQAWLKRYRPNVPNSKTQ